MDDKDVSVAVGNIISVVGIKKVEKISNKEFSTSLKLNLKRVILTLLVCRRGS